MPVWATARPLPDTTPESAAHSPQQHPPENEEPAMSVQSEKQSTRWYENVAEGTFHEVYEGSDTEKHLRRQMRQVSDDPDDLEPAYRRVTKSELPAKSQQPGYVRGKDEPASPVEPVSETPPQTPTADTDKGPLVGEPGAEEQAEREVELGGAAPAGVEPEVTAQAAAATASSRSRRK